MARMSRSEPPVGLDERGLPAETPSGQTHEVDAVRPRDWRAVLPLALTLIAVAIFGALCLYHYRLPGLYYDEAFDTVPALQLLRGEPVQLARGVGIHLFGHTFPVMTGDYWGSVSTYAVLPLFWLFGYGVLAVRLWPIGAGMLAVLLTYFAGKRLYDRWTGAGAALLLAVFPSFIFWSRVGIYVISHIVAITLGVLLSFLRWRSTGHRRWLFLATLLAGIGLWTKLLYLWFLIAVPAAYVILLIADWLAEDRREGPARSLAGVVSMVKRHIRADLPLRDWWDAGAALLGFLIGAFPVIYYNIVSQGSYILLRSNLFHTQKGVSNFAIWSNVKVELDAVRVLLDGGYFWFYGGIYHNQLYPWFAGLATLGLLILVHRAPMYRRCRRATVFLLGFVVVIFVLSCFTISILGATHLLILLPIPQFFIAACAVFVARWVRERLAGMRGLRVAPARLSLAAVAIALLVFVPLMARDLWVDADYHQALARTGGYSTFSSAIYSLADYLKTNKISRPYALDWGFRYNLIVLTGGDVDPLEIYGGSYEPGPDFARDLQAALKTPNPVFISHTADSSAFPRLDAFRRIVAQDGKQLELVRTFKQLDGKPVYYLFRVKG